MFRDYVMSLMASKPQPAPLVSRTELVAEVIAAREERRNEQVYGGGGPRAHAAERRLQAAWAALRAHDEANPAR